MRLNAGFSLIEVLVSVVILSIGLLGVAGLQLAGLRYGQGAYQQSQATIVVADLIDRMRANPDVEAAASQYQFDTASDSEPSDPECIATGCSPTELARHDVRQWRRTALPVLGPSATATVTRTGDVYNITVQWDEVAERNGEDAVNRTVTTAVQL